MRDNKGKFTKGNNAAKKKHKSKFIVSNNAAKKKLPTEKVKEIDHLTDDYLPFGDDNSFPERTAELNRKSPISRSVVNSKRQYVTGEGFDTENQNFLNYKPNNNETLRDVTSKIVLDKLVTGNAYIEIVKDARNNIVQLYHKDSTKVRLHKNGTHAIIHPKWSKYTSYKKYAKVIPLYPMFEEIDGYMRSIYHIKEYEAEFNYYGIPSNLGAIDAANINYKTNKWNLSRLENAFNTSGIMQITADFSEEDADSFVDEFNNKFTGEGNQGKPLMLINEIGSESDNSKYIPITTNEEGNWTQLHEQATEEIIIANQWFRGLSGISDNTGFDTSRLQNEYQIAISTIIPYEQKFIIEAYTKILNEQLNFGLDDLKFINTSPISLIDLDNVHQAIIDINTEVQEQRMTEEMAKQVLRISFQLTEEQLENLFV